MKQLNPFRAGISGGTKPGRGKKFHDGDRRKSREEWAAFCMMECPHPSRLCERGTCPEFKAKFGDRRDH